MKELNTITIEDIIADIENYLANCKHPLLEELTDDGSIGDNITEELADCEWEINCLDDNSGEKYVTEIINKAADRIMALIERVR